MMRHYLLFGTVLLLSQISQATPLHDAVRFGNRWAAQALLADGGDLYAIDAQQRTPFAIALAAGNHQMVTLLLVCAVMRAQNRGQDIRDDAAVSRVLAELTPLLNQNLAATVTPPAEVEHSFVREEVALNLDPRVFASLRFGALSQQSIIEDSLHHASLTGMASILPFAVGRLTPLRQTALHLFAMHTDRPLMIFLLAGFGGSMHALDHNGRTAFAAARAAGRERNALALLLCMVRELHVGHTRMNGVQRVRDAYVNAVDGVRRIPADPIDEAALFGMVNGMIGFLQTVFHAVKEQEVIAMRMFQALSLHYAQQRGALTMVGRPLGVWSSCATSGSGIW